MQILAIALLLLSMIACSKDSNPVVDSPLPAGKGMQDDLPKVESPTNLRVSKIPGGVIALKWNAPANEDGHNGNYRVQLKRSYREWDDVTFYTTGSKGMRFSRIVVDVVYDWRVRALSRAEYNDSDWSYGYFNSNSIEAQGYEGERPDAVEATPSPQPSNEKPAEILTLSEIKSYNTPFNPSGYEAEVLSEPTLRESIRRRDRHHILSERGLLPTVSVTGCKQRSLDSGGNPISIGGQSVYEAIFTLERDGPTTESLTIKYSISDNGDPDDHASLHGARAGGLSGFTPGSSTFSIHGGEFVASYSVYFWLQEAHYTTDSHYNSGGEARVGVNSSSSDCD
ncbi:MAG: fibronectin type III domain-containing protein [Gemmatimonadota bacterium]|nr:fibronectin type III domain-containing protein [Gemmatimonadota bacterium]